MDQFDLLSRSSLLYTKFECLGLKPFVSFPDLITSSRLKVPSFPFIPLTSLQSSLPSKGVFLEMENSAAGWALRASEPLRLNH